MKDKANTAYNGHHSEQLASRLDLFITHASLLLSDLHETDTEPGSFWSLDMGHLALQRKEECGAVKWGINVSLLNNGALTPILNHSPRNVRGKNVNLFT